jgi:hypothetical protein
MNTYDLQQSLVNTVLTNDNIPVEHNLWCQIVDYTFRKETNQAFLYLKEEDSVVVLDNAEVDEDDKNIYIMADNKKYHLKKFKH